MMVLTSTCIQTLYFLQMSAIAMRGSNAPYTVVPAVALTRKGTNPCKKAATRYARSGCCSALIPQHPQLPWCCPHGDPTSVSQRTSLLCHTAFSTFRCQRYYSFYLKVAANFQTSILHLLGCMRQVRAQQNNSASHHLPETRKSALQDVT